MTKYLNCTEAMKGSMAKFNRKYARKFAENEDKTALLFECCEMIDSLLEEFDDAAVDIAVFKDAGGVIITLESYDFVIRDEDHCFFKVVEKSDRVRFGAVDDEHVYVAFMFSDVWKKVG